MKMDVNKALWENCKVGNVEEVRRALETGADPNSSNEGMSCLMIAAEENHAEVVSLLLDQPNIEVNLAADHDETALHYACIYNSEAALRRLLSAPGLDLHAKYLAGGGFGFTPIMFAVSHHALECVRLLSEVDEVDLDCKFPAHMDHASLEEW